MKRFICLLFVLSFLCAQAQSKVVKLGRNSMYSTAATSTYSDSLSAIAKKCDVNCLNCDTGTGKCLKCASNRYISGELCLNCPDKNYCDGETAVPNCTGVTCLGNSVPEATDTGCCCVKK